MADAPSRHVFRIRPEAALESLKDLLRALLDDDVVPEPQPVICWAETVSRSTAS